MNFGLILTGGNPQPWQVSSARLGLGTTNRADGPSFDCAFDAVVCQRSHTAFSECDCLRIGE